MAKRRRFTPEFKAEVVFEVISGVSSQAELCRRCYRIRRQTHTVWLKDRQCHH